MILRRTTEGYEVIRKVGDCRIRHPRATVTKATGSDTAPEYLAFSEGITAEQMWVIEEKPDRGSPDLRSPNEQFPRRIPASSFMERRFLD